MSGSWLMILKTAAIVAVPSFALGYLIAVPESKQASLKQLARRVGICEVRLFGNSSTLQAGVTNLSEAELVVSTLENNMERHPKSFGRRIYHVDGAGQVYDTTRPPNQAYVGKLTDEELSQYFAAKRRRNVLGMRTVLANMPELKNIYGVYLDPILDCE